MEVSTCLICATKVGAAARLTNAPPVNGDVVISWNSRGILEIANQVTGPWTRITNAANPYTNAITTDSRFFRLNQTVDATTLRKKVPCGYQGWFRCPGDGGNQWIHWSRSTSSIASNTAKNQLFDGRSGRFLARLADGPKRNRTQWFAELVPATSDGL